MSWVLMSKVQTAKLIVTVTRNSRTKSRVVLWRDVRACRLFDAETESRRSKLVLDWHSELAERPQVVLKGPFVRLKLQHSRYA